jgi:iron complex outermembrane receptor protein
MSRNRLLLGGSLMCLLIGQSVVARAQEEPSVVKSAPPGSVAARTPKAPVQSNGVEEVVVQARKKKENLVKIPVAVSVLSAKQMQLRSIHNVDGISDTTPGFHSTDQSVARNDRGFNLYTIRGIVSGVTATRPGVTLFMDGTPIAGGNIAGLTDIDHVEVIKGPQSAYFGRSTFAGAINFITTPPSDYWHGAIDVEYGSYGTTDDTITEQGPLIPGILDLRASYHHYSTSGEYNDELEPGVKLGKRNTDSGTFEFHATPSSDLTMNLFYNKWNDDDGPSAQSELGSGFVNCNPAGGSGVGYTCGKIGIAPTSGFLYDVLPTAQNLVGMVGQSNEGTSPFINAVSPSILDTIGLARRAYQMHVNFTYDIDGSGYVVAGNVARDENNWMEIQGPIGYNNLNLPDPFYGVVKGAPKYDTDAINAAATDDDFSAELRLSSPQNGRFKWTIGTNYYEQKSYLSTTAELESGPATFLQDGANNAYTVGVFGAASYDILKSLTFTFEGRGQWDTLRSYVIDTPLSYEATYPSFSPRFILSYRPLDELMLYTSFSRGYRPGEFNAAYATATPDEKAQVAKIVPSVASAVPQEKLNMLEAGFKAQFFQDRIRFLADAYYGDWSNYHITNEVPVEESGVVNTVQTVFAGGRILLHGVEAEATYRVTHDLTLEGSFDWAATNVRNDVCSTCILINGIANNRGNSLPSYPTFTGTLSATYTHPVWHEDYIGFAHADYLYTGKQYADETNLTYIGSNNRLNMQIGLRHGPYELALVGTNITNSKTPTAISDTNDAFISNRENVILSPAYKPYYGFRLHISM